MTRISQKSTSLFASMTLANRDFTISWGGRDFSSDSKFRNSSSYAQIQISFWVVRDGWFLFRRNKLAVCREFNHSLMDAQFTLERTNPSCQGIGKSKRPPDSSNCHWWPRFQGSQSSTHYFQTAQIQTYVTKTFPSLSFLHRSPKKHDPDFFYWNPAVSVWKRFHFSWLFVGKFPARNQLLTAEMSHNQKNQETLDLSLRCRAGN